MLTVADLPSFALDGETYVRPDFAGRGLANVAPTLVRLLAPSAAPPALPSLDPSCLPDRPPPWFNSVAWMVAAGLGHLQLRPEIAWAKARTLGRMIKRKGQ